MTENGAAPASGSIMVVGGGISGLTAALEGKSISGPAKTRMLRAVNHILEQRKKPTVDLRALF